MATKKSMQEKIEEAKEKTRKTQERLDKLKAEEKALIAKYNEQERKARTKRLIESAATMESILDVELNKENAAYYSKCIQLGLIAIKFLGRSFAECDIQGLDNFLQAQEDRGNYYSNFMNNYYSNFMDELLSK